MATFGSIFVLAKNFFAASNFWWLFFRNVISFVEWFILAIGVSFTALKASLLDVWSFLVFVAGSMTQFLSSLDSCMQIPTPVKSVFVMNSAADKRLSAASLLPLSVERCEPTSMMGIGGFSSIKERAAAVNPIVSVPWGSIIPLIPPFFISSSIAFAIIG